MQKTKALNTRFIKESSTSMKRKTLIKEEELFNKITKAAKFIAQIDKLKNDNSTVNSTYLKIMQIIKDQVLYELNYLRQSIEKTY
jgi:hypothetical protein